MNEELRNLLQCFALFCIRAMAIIALFAIIGCGTSHNLTSNDVVWVDDDRYHVPQPPKERDPHYGWDFIHRSFIYPVDRILDFPRYLGSSKAQNTNVLGEVPNSSWYTNRHAYRRMTLEELIAGPNKGTGPDPKGTWM